MNGPIGHSREGQLVIQEKGISIEMMLGVMDILEEELLDDTTADSRRHSRTIAVCGGALVILYGRALQAGRGEFFLLEASELAGDEYVIGLKDC